MGLKVEYQINGRPVSKKQFEKYKDDPSRLADMVKTGVGPALNTDATFLQGRGKLRDQFGGDDEAFIETVREARRNGYEPQENDFYVESIADRVGDPRAFVKSKGEVKRVLEERGMESRGAIKTKGRAPESDPLLSEN